MFNQQELHYEWQEIGGFILGAGVITLLLAVIT